MTLHAHRRLLRAFGHSFFFLNGDAAAQRGILEGIKATFQNW